MRTVILLDLNAFFASCHQAENPEWRGQPLAVAGTKEERNGIVLTASYEAREKGIKTGMLVGEAKKLCPDLILVRPHFSLYEDYSMKVMNILREFSPQVEVFSIDEAWVDVTNSLFLFGDGKAIADKMRAKIRKELGITASVGVSYCKIMAKLASDMKKPDATTVIMQEDIKTKVWPLNIEKIIGVGRKTKEKLNGIGIYTLKDLAESQLKVIESLLGKSGRSLWLAANGIDDSEVVSSRADAKGVGNSVTTKNDMQSMDDASAVLLFLSEEVGRRLREHGYEGNVIDVTIKRWDFICCTRQHKIEFFTSSTKDIYEESVRILSRNWDGKTPLRLLGVRVTNLRRSSLNGQISFFESRSKEKIEKLDKCIDTINRKYGSRTVQRAALINKSIKGVESDKKET